MEEIRAKINKEFLIRIYDGKKSMLVGFTRLCMMVGDLHAMHYAKKALKSKDQVPTFSYGRLKKLTIAFNPR